MLITCRECFKTKRHKGKGLCGACHERSRRANNPTARNKHRLSSAAYKRNNPVKTYKKRLAKKHGINNAKIDSLFLIKHCEICQTTNQALYVDHCHLTSQVRGRLCRACNFALGQFKDNQQVILNAVKYLDKYDTANRKVDS